MTAEHPDREQVLVAESEAGERLDRLLAARTALSRSRLKALILDGQVTIGPRTVRDPGYRVNAGDSIAIEVPPAQPADPEGEPIPLKVVFEDADIIVIDKPAGLVVHPAAGHWSGTLVNALIAHCGASLSGIGGVKRPGIVHRLDKDTSGVMVVAKTDAAHQGLAAQFADHGRDGDLDRRYLALVWGALTPGHGRVEGNIGRHATNRLKMAVLSRGGKHAVTTYNTEATFGAKKGAKSIASLLECRLETGRTHQIRVHLAHMGHPVIGDALYGAGWHSKTRALPETSRFAILSLKRQALHAAVLGFHHPITGHYLRFRSELPDDMREAIEALAR
jgi:23S rRNA pseudouridine1911/1915/1917 synthase